MLSAVMLLGIVLLPYAGGAQAAERYKPFVLASKGPGDFQEKVKETEDALKNAGFEILGEYTPYKDTFVDNTRVIVVTNDELKKVAGMSRYGAFAAPWRVAVTQYNGEIQVAYENPLYFANAYRLKSDLKDLAETLKNALGAQETFGSKKGLTARKLRKYHYTFGMEYFDDVYELAEYDSHQKAVDTVEKNLEAGVGGVTKVYRLDLGNNVTIFGVARKAPPGGDEHMDEEWIMKNVDFAPLKGTAYLPYEILVDGDKVVALHMRFRMAVHYPDLKMMGKNSFMNIMPSPKAVEVALKTVAGGK
ncbi:MAG TPA: hypothetical protein ENK05_05520 [Gammaproteobacteria bacterium]|nr:hypothetical protein [Gammaproteobacteria bacterium]